MSAPATLPSQAQQNPGIFAQLKSFIVEEGPPWLRYLYYLRFSIFLWSFPLVLWWANWRGHARSLVSGVLTPETWGQYLCVFFFLTSGSVVALIIARLVVVNGQERFGDRPPVLLARLLADTNARYEWVPLVLFQINSLILAIYFFSNGAAEGISPSQIALGLGAGLVTSLLFWYSLTAIYYLSYRPENWDASKAELRLGRAAARTMILPRSWLGLSTGDKPSRFGDALENSTTRFHFGGFKYLFPVLGYRWSELESKPLYEGFYFSILAALGFFGLYAILWPLTAPVPAPTASAWALGLEITACLAVCLLVLTTQPRAPGGQPAVNPTHLRNWKIFLVSTILLFALVVFGLCRILDVARFPVLASVLILVIWLSWLFAALAFGFDRFRVPVLTVFLLVLILPRLFNWTGAREEHFLSIALRPTQASLHSPSEILDWRIRQETKTATGQAQQTPTPPTFIIVTSTGGGIHAAAWTTEVLRRLEMQFGGHFHEHVLLLSTVSGGSVGLLSYLRELHAMRGGAAPQWNRMTSQAECSSLEAVGWGLVYHDLDKAIIPFFPGLIPPSDGVDDLQKTPLGKDRTWALRRAFERNLNNPHCKPLANPGLEVPVSEVAAGAAEDKADYQQLTLAGFDPMLDANPYPAFSMNTTSVENGSRFLLANYKVNHGADPGSPNPAESFLDVYGGLHPTGSGYVDLPLQTAAQLSATFPYVSSAATFPAIPGKEGVHFVDGGYYDNDGTATALEFLRNALEGSTALGPTPPGPPQVSGLRSSRPMIPAPKKIRILLVEIRNSTETNARPLPLALKNDPGDKCKAWNLGDQVTAPLKAFYAGGHESVTGRNRAILAVLEQAYADRLMLRHFVITDQTNGSDNVSCIPDKDPATDPLNWSLTPKQRSEVVNSADQYNARYEHIHNCFANDSVCPKGEEEIPH